MFVAGGLATPADASLMMQMGAQAVFVGSGIFKSDNPSKRAHAIVKATTHFDKPAEVLNASRGLGTPMVGIARNAIPEGQKLAARGW
jgi:pyridoxal 5'-phosphate synthase pdxS subunit